MKFDAKTQPSIEPSDNNFSMPTIVHIEENVAIEDPTVKISPTSPPATIEEQPSLPPVPYPYIYQPPSFYLSSVRTPYNLYFPDSSPFPTTYQKSGEAVSNTKSDLTWKPRSSPIIMSLLEKPIAKFPAIAPRSSNIVESLSNKRILFPHSPLKSTPTDPLPKYQRTSLSPYPPTKTYLVPLSSHCSSLLEHPQNHNVHCTKASLPIPSSPIQNQSVELSRAIVDHHPCDIDQISKLVIRHRKTYRAKIIDTMGQLFPDWFNAPDYRCIHCFTCDRVYTPQFFMTHVDDQQMINEQPIEMTSIQLLTSEKMSESKVHL